MTYKQYQKVLENQLKELNEKIDLKVLRGESYSAEAKRHKALLAQARKIQREKLWQKFTSLFTFKRYERRA